eukprot:UN25203
MTWASLIKLCADCGQYAHFVKACEQAKTSYTRKTYHAFLEGSVLFGDVKMAIEGLKRYIHHYKPGNYDYGQLLKCCDVYGDLYTAQIVYNQWCQKSEEEDELNLTGIMIEMLGRRGKESPFFNGRSN